MRWWLSWTKKKKIITSENPSIRDVEKALINYLSRAKNNSNKNITVSEKEIRELTDAIYLAGFSKDGITKEIYEKGEKMKT